MGVCFGIFRMGSWQVSDYVMDLEMLGIHVPAPVKVIQRVINASKKRYYPFIISEGINILDYFNSYIFTIGWTTRNVQRICIYCVAFFVF